MFHSYRTRQLSFNTDESMNNSLERTQSDLDSLELYNSNSNILSPEEIQTDPDNIEKAEEDNISISSAVECIDRMYAEIIAKTYEEKKFLCVSTQTEFFFLKRSKKIKNKINIKKRTNKIKNKKNIKQRSKIRILFEFLMYNFNIFLFFYFIFSFFE